MNFLVVRTGEIIMLKTLECMNLSLTFFSSPAFRYYLPAFMLASIRDPVRADVIDSGIIFHLERAVTGENDRLNAFSPQEREAVARFVEWYRDSDDFWEQGQRKQFTALADTLRKT